jgi:hypothetical protein
VAKNVRINPLSMIYLILAKKRREEIIEEEEEEKIEKFKCEVGVKQQTFMKSIVHALIKNN